MAYAQSQGWQAPQDGSGFDAYNMPHLGPGFGGDGPWYSAGPDIEVNAVDLDAITNYGGTVVNAPAIPGSSWFRNGNLSYFIFSDSNTAPGKNGDQVSIVVPGTSLGNGPTLSIRGFTGVQTTLIAWPASGDISLGGYSTTGGITPSSAFNRVYIASSPGVPTGIPWYSDPANGFTIGNYGVAVTPDTTNHRLYVWDGSWKPEGQYTGGSGIGCLETDNAGLWTVVPCGSTGLYYQTIDNAGSAVTQRSAWNASTGLTAVDNGGATRTDVTANLSTGVSGGQTAIGGTATTDSLTLKATSATPTAGAQINFQNVTNFFDATTDALTISGSAPSSFTSSSTSSQALVIHSPNSSNAPTVNTGTLRIDQTGTDQPGITFTKGGTLAGAMRVNTSGSYEIYGAGVTFYGSQSSQTNSVVTGAGRIAINGSSGSNAAASNGSIEVRDNGNQTALALTRSGSGSLQDILRSNTGGTGSITLQIGTAENDGMALVTNGTAGGTAGRRVIIDGAGNVAMSTSPATTATDGFLFPTATLGPPTGSVTAKTGAAAVDVDATNNRLYAYNSGWKIYGQSTALLATGPLCNTTSTGVDYACVAGTDYQTPLTACTDYVSLTCVTGATDLGGTNATPTVIGIEDAGKARGYIDWTARSVPANPTGTITREYNSLFGAGLVTLDSSGNARYMVPDHTCGASNWVSSSGSGTLACTQPAFSDLSGSATCAQLPALTGGVTSSAGSCATTVASVPCGALPAFGGDLTSAGGTCSVQVQAIEEPSGPARLSINAIPDLGSGNAAILNRPGGTGTVVGTSSVSLYGGPQGGSVSTNYVAYAPGVIGYGNWAIPYATHRTTADVQNAAMEVPVGFAAKKQRVLAWVTSNSLGSGGGGSSVTACQSTQNGVGTSVFAGGGGGIPNTSTGLFDSGITAVSSSAATDTWGLSCGGTSPLGGTINMTVTVVLYQ